MRQFKRAPSKLEAELISDNANYKGFIENLCDAGLCITTVPMHTAVDFIPGKVVKLKFRLPSGEILNIQGEIRWLHSYKTPSQELIINTMGMELINPPSKYKEFIKTL